MESRRLAILCSHLRQTDLNRSSLPKRSSSENFSWVSTSNCDSNGPDGKSFRGSEKEREEKDCVFCKIIRGESPAFKLYEDDVCLCILDLNPLNHGHSLIIPKSHYSSLEATPPSVVASMCSKVPFVSSAIMKATHCDSFNLLVNSGEAAGQVIFHTHLHIIPRKARDHLWTSKLASVT
ncbi:Histidine triad (HIT) protein [Macleaya cordata]|uniref:Histidine triad (HIT) protein n=1 Tax=Macleaya cordata TaxID=56857 RepID=A0A200PYI9_MACCD|nr:Histidine triad (HIT) protein [Macleaya cordata]